MLNTQQTVRRTFCRSRCNVWSRHDKIRRSYSTIFPTDHSSKQIRLGIRNQSSSSSSLSTSTSTSTSTYDKSPNWRDWFSAAEYENPWDASSPRLQPLDFAPADYATKHIISLLQNVHRYCYLSSNSFGNKVTTEQCNSALNNLLELIPSQKEGRLSLEDSNVERTQRITERANAILENMELVDDILSSATNTNQHDHQQSTSLLPNQRKKPSSLPPKPNRDTYNTILQIFARTAGTREVPQRATEIVERMQWRYATRHELELQPVSFHWNCVLLAWAHCDDWEKPVHALRLILDKAAQDPALVDHSSYIHLLRMCSRHSQRTRDRGPQSSKETKLGASVAVKLWQVLFESEDDPGSTALPVTGPLQSHFYSHFLQAIRALDVGSPMRHRYYANAFQRAVDQGKLNRYVLQEFFLHVQDSATFDRFLGPYRRDVFGMNADEAVQKILKVVPPEWTQNANDEDISRQPPPKP